MSKFKVGDRVRVGVEEDDRNFRPFLSSGIEGVIIAIDHGGYDVRLNVDKEDLASDGTKYHVVEWVYDGSELELIND